MGPILLKISMNELGKRLKTIGSLILPIIMRKKLKQSPRSWRKISEWVTAEWHASRWEFSIENVLHQQSRRMSEHECCKYPPCDPTEKELSGKTWNTWISKLNPKGIINVHFCTLSHPDYGFSFRSMPSSFGFPLLGDLLKEQLTLPGMSHRTRQGSLGRMQFYFFKKIRLDKKHISL